MMRSARTAPRDGARHATIRAGCVEPGHVLITVFWPDARPSYFREARGAKGTFFVERDIRAGTSAGRCTVWCLCGRRVRFPSVSAPGLLGPADRSGPYPRAAVMVETGNAGGGPWGGGPSADPTGAAELIWLCTSCDLDEWNASAVDAANFAEGRRMWRVFTPASIGRAAGARKICRLAD